MLVVQEMVCGVGAGNARFELELCQEVTTVSVYKSTSVGCEWQFGSLGCVDDSTEMVDQDHDVSFVVSRRRDKIS